MKTALLLPISLLLVSGCATRNSQSEIDFAAWLWHYSRVCAEAGFIDRDTAGRGMAYASSRIYASESPRLQEKIKTYDSNVDQAGCNKVALRIAEAGTTQAIRQATPQVQPSAPVNTTCRTTFGFTHCTTY